MTARLSEAPTGGAQRRTEAGRRAQSGEKPSIVAAAHQRAERRLVELRELEAKAREEMEEATRVAKDLDTAHAKRLEWEKKVSADRDIKTEGRNRLRAKRDEAQKVQAAKLAEVRELVKWRMRVACETRLHHPHVSRNTWQRPRQPESQFGCAFCSTTWAMTI